MSSSDVHAGDTISATITEPLILNGQTFYIKFFTETTVVAGEETEAHARLARAAVQGLTDLINETVAARSRTRKGH